MKAENRHMRDAARGSPLVRSSQGMAGVFNDDESVALGQLEDRIQIGRVPGIVHGQNRARAVA